MYTYLWARGPNNDAVQLQYLLLDSGNMVAASYPVDAYADISVTLIHTYQHFTMVRAMVGRVLMPACTRCTLAQVLLQYPALGCVCKHGLIVIDV